MLILVSSLLFLLEGVVLAAIGYPEAKTYNTDLNSRVGILLMMIALSALVIMIASRAKQALAEQSAHTSGISSPDWIPTRLFLIGWGIAVLSAYFIVTVVLRVISYYTRLYDHEYPVTVDWCYDCGGWDSSLGPELSIVVSAISSVGFVIGIIMVATKGRRTLSHPSR